jgi:hypothetical protein
LWRRTDCSLPLRLELARQWVERRIGTARLIRVYELVRADVSEVAVLEAIGAPAADQEKIFAGNARGLLGLA